MNADSGSISKFLISLYYYENNGSRIYSIHYIMVNLVLLHFLYHLLMLGLLFKR